jgi:GTP-binding protein
MAGRDPAVSVGSDRRPVHYALFYIQERGTLFVNPGDKVHVGMILGENSRGSDLEVNLIKEKKLTNVRAPARTMRCC